MKTFEPEKTLSKELEENFELSFHNDFIENKSVVGIDIYKYSEYPTEVQIYVPVLFNALYRLTVTSCLKKEKFFFQKYGDSFNYFKSHFISTGDGGFQIFDNPVQSVIFACYFQLNVQRFNAGSLVNPLNDNLFRIIGRIELRYAITYDKIYSYDNNFYGPSIINNSRILSKDHLNRLLIDFPTLDWFNKNINTIENLLIMNKEDFITIEYFIKYKETETTLLFDKTEESIIKAVDILKIGTLKSKNTILEVYNLKIQFNILINKVKNNYGNFLVTLGNLNTQGIE